MKTAISSNADYSEQGIQDLLLAGVANRSLDINEARRILKSITAILADCGLQPSTVSRYQDWLATRQT